MKKEKSEHTSRADKTAFESREFRKLSRPVLAENMLRIADIARKERRVRDDKLGNFSEGGRIFSEGEKIRQINEEIKDKEDLVSKLQEKSKGRKSSGNEEHLRIVSQI